MMIKDYQVNSKKVCRECFCAANDISKYELEVMMSQNKGKNNNENDVKFSNLLSVNSSNISSVKSNNDVIMLVSLLIFF